MKLDKILMAVVMMVTTSVWAQVPQTPPVAASTPSTPTAPPPPSTPPPPMPGTSAGSPVSVTPATPTPPPPSAPSSAATPSPTAAGTPPVATAVAPTGEEMVYLNVQDADIRDIIKQISKATGRNFIMDDNVKGKITIISEKPMTKEEAYQTFLSALAVVGFTTVKGPAGVLKVVRLKDSIQMPIATHVDSTPYTDSFVTRLVQLSNISALDMSNAIKGLISKDGNLFAYPATNTLIITDSGTNIDRLMKIIKELDQEGPQQILEIIPVKNALARDVGQTVNTLFQQEKGAAGKPKAPGELDELDEVSKIIPDERTNSIIVLASKRAIEKVRSIIARLDAKVSAGQEGRIHVYYLRYAKAKQLAETLSALTSGAGQKPQPAAAAAGGAARSVVAEFEGGVKVAADEATNSIIVTATAKDFQTLIDRVISKLDQPRRQVYIETVVMELTLRKNRQLGVSAYGGGGGSAVGFGQSFGAASAVGPALLTGGASLLGGVLSSRTINIQVLDSTGTSKTVSVPAFSAFLQAVQTYGDTNVVSTPNILTVENEEAMIEVKSDQPIPSATPASATSAVLTQSYTTKEAGLTLKVTPQIGSNNAVLLKLDQELSNFGEKVPFPGGFNIPTSKKRHIKTSTVVNDGQTVVLGGLMEDQVGNTVNKIPLLGDIPLLGFLFRQTTKEMVKNNLLIFLTPHIMNDASDFSRILQNKIEQRNQFIEQNYGRKQREAIKNTIKTHRQDLLEFKEAADLLPDTTFDATANKTGDPFPAVPGPAASATTPAKVKPKPAPPPPTPPSGVITVPPLSPGR